MSDAMVPAPGQLLSSRYRLEQALQQGRHGRLWRAVDQLAGDAPVAIWQLEPGPEGEQEQQLWSRWQQVLHPQVPRLGAPIQQDGAIWLVRDWPAGRTYQQLLDLRLQRGLVYGPGEMQALLRQLLPLLAMLHGMGLVHGDLRPQQLLRRDADGLPLLLDWASLSGVAPWPADRQGPARDLQDLALLALTLMSGLPAEQLQDPLTGRRLWPALLAEAPAFRGALQRLLGDAGAEPLTSAAEALALFEGLEPLESTGPLPLPDPAVMAEPQPAAAASAALAQAAAAPQPQPELPPLPRTPAAPRRRGEVREEAAEGGLWSVLIALVLSALVGTALGWWFLSRSRAPAPGVPDAALELPASLPQAEVDQRQQLLNRLRAMQVDRAWFLRLVDASLLSRFPERGGRLPGDRPEDAPLRRVWNDLAEEWLARVEQLPLEVRSRLGSFSMGDWERRQRGLVAQGLSPAVLRQLVSGSAQVLLPGRADAAADLPPEPFRQLWFAAAEQSLANVSIAPIVAQSRQTRVVSAEVEASGARLFPIRLPAGHRLVLGVNGSPLMEMTVFAADGSPLEPRGPLRVVSLAPQQRSPIQLLVTNDGVAPALITLSLRADPSAAAPAAGSPLEGLLPWREPRPQPTPPANPPVSRPAPPPPLAAPQTTPESGPPPPPNG